MPALLFSATKDAVILPLSVPPPKAPSSSPWACRHQKHRHPDRERAAPKAPSPKASSFWVWACRT